MSGARPMNPQHAGDAALLAFKAECRGALGENLSPDEIAEVCMVDPSMVSRWFSKTCRDSIGPDNIVMLASDPRTVRYARALVAYQARELGDVLVDTGAVARALDVASTARTVKEASEALSARVSVLSNRTPANLLAFAKEADEAVRELASDAAAARREAAVPVRRIA